MDTLGPALWACKHTAIGSTSSQQTLLSLVAVEDLELRQLDVTTAFLNGELEEDIYIKQPPGYEEGGPGMVCHLRRALYGLRQAPRAWHIRLKQELEDIGFLASDADPGLFTLCNKTDNVYLLVYVDDISVACKDRASADLVVASLKAAFNVRDLGEATYFIGIKLIRDRSLRALKINQERLASELVSKYGLELGKTKSIPLSTGIKLYHEEDDLLDKTKFAYAELVGSLLYLAVCTRPDITQSVGALARYMAKPSTTHWQAAKGVLRYIAGTVDYGINFKRSGTSSLQSYCDSDYAGDLDYGLCLHLQRRGCELVQSAASNCGSVYDGGGVHGSSGCCQGGAVATQAVRRV